MSWVASIYIAFTLHLQLFTSHLHLIVYLVKYLKGKGAKSVKTCTLLDKPSRRTVEMVPDYVGREIPDEFVIGYGLDYDEKYRALPYVGVLKRSVYEQ